MVSALKSTEKENSCPSTTQANPTLKLANGSTKEVSFLKKHGSTLLKWGLIAFAIYLLAINLWPLVIAGTVGYCIGAFSENPFKQLYHKLKG